MKKEEKYLKETRRFRIEQQIKKSTFEMALYFDYFGFDKEQINNIYNTTLDNLEFTSDEKDMIFKKTVKMLDDVYNIKI